MITTRGAVEGVACIVTSDNRGRGMGILIDRDRVLTCAHVINSAIGHSTIASEPPGKNERITVTFPFAQRETRTASVAAWSPPGLGNADAALLFLDESAPEAAGIATLAEVADSSRLDGTLTVFGITGEQVLGGHAEVVVAGTVAGGWWQLVGNRDIGTYAVKGFSGAGIWSRAERAVVAMLVAVAAVPDTTPERTAAVLTVERRTAYGQPVAAIRAAIAELPVERRSGSEATQRLYTVSALLLFVVAFVHLLALQSKGALAMLPYANDSHLVAAFFAANIIALIAWLPFLLLRRHVGSLAPSRPWYQRVPSLFGRYPSDSLLNTGIGSVAALIFLVVLPLWTQGVALRQFRQNDHVVLVALARFGQACPDAGSHCPHRDARLFSAIGLPGPYFNNVYRIAGKGDGADKAVAFFPILQPSLVLVLTALAAALAISTLFELFGRPLITRRASH